MVLAQPPQTELAAVPVQCDLQCVLVVADVFDMALGCDQDQVAIGIPSRLNKACLITPNTQQSEMRAQRHTHASEGQQWNWQQIGTGIR